MIKEIRMPLSEYEQLKEIERKYRESEKVITVRFFKNILNPVEKKYYINANSKNVSKELEDILEIFREENILNLVYNAEAETDKVIYYYDAERNSHEKLKRQYNKIPKWIRSLFA